jgi:molecular chaperone GrpE (heat shock protein)
MLDDSNLFFRGQVMEIVMSITDCDSFDWFNPPAGDTTVLSMHYRMSSLTEHPTFLLKLFSNRTSSYPGGSFRALQLLAFWISWVRAMKTKDQILRLSNQMLEEIRKWGYEKLEFTSDEEMELAKTLYNDFGHDQFQRGSVAIDIDAKASHDENASFYVTGAVMDESDKELSLAKVPAFCIQESSTNNESNADKNAVNPSKERQQQQQCQSEGGFISFHGKLDEVMKAKEEGNSKYREGNYPAAIDDYSEAIRRANDLLRQLECSLACVDNTIRYPEPPEVVLKNLQDEKLIATLNFNLATALWKRSEGLSVSQTDKKTFLLECIDACRKTLDLEPSHRKALYRLCAALLLLDRPGEALEVLDEKLALTLGTEVSSAQKENELLKAMRAKCVAAVMLSSRAIANNTLPLAESSDGNKKAPSVLVGDRVAKMMEALQARKQREKGSVAHAWNGWTPPVEQEPASDFGKGQHQTGQADQQSSTAAAAAAALEGSPDDSQQACIPPPQDTITTESSDKKIAVSQTTKKPQKATTTTTSKTSTVKTTKTKKASAKALEAYSKLKRAANEYEHLRGRSGAISEEKRDEKESSLIQHALNSIDTIWDESVTLKQVSSGSLEEPLILLLLAVIKALGTAEASKGRNLLLQLAKCDRFYTELQLIVCGDAALKASIADTLAMLVSTTGDAGEVDEAPFTVEYGRILDIINK